MSRLCRDVYAMRTRRGPETAADRATYVPCRLPSCSVLHGRGRSLLPTFVYETPTSLNIFLRSCRSSCSL